MGRLDTLFAPQRVAVVGATDREGAVGRSLLENLRGFDGTVLPINPDRESVLGFECYPDPASAAPIDLGVVAVPPGGVLDALEALADTGTRDVVVITAGFSETGSEGAKRERDLAELARGHDLNLIGPNSLGVMSTGVSLNASFAPADPLEGSISLLSQSGAFITAVLDWATDQGIGVRDVASVGNATVLTETDLIEHWGEDDETEVIVGYVEGIDDGSRFIEVAKEVARETPVVLVKAGRTDAGARAASSHTGSIAGMDAAYDAGLGQAGVIRAHSVQELFDVARSLDGLEVPPNDDVVVVTNAGGPGVLATDAIGDTSLTVADLGEETTDALRDRMPDAAAVHNPVDIIGDADAERFREALDVTLADPEVGAALVVSAPTAVLSSEELAETIVAASERHDTPIVPCMMGGESVEAAATHLRGAGIPNFFDPTRAVTGLEALSHHRDVAARDPDPPVTFEDVDRDRVETILSERAERGERSLGVESMAILEAYGIPVPDGAVVDDPAEAAALAADIEGDVVCKIASPDIAHKTDIGGVRVGVPDDEVADVFEDIVTKARNYQPDATILGVQVQEQVDLEDATETILGVTTDPQFGPLVVFGLGGIFVEILEDTSIRVAPFGDRAARSMVEEIRAAPLLRGARGREPADLDAVTEAILRIGQLVTDHPAILELDINPLVAGPDGVQAIDFVATTDPDQL